MYRVHNEKCYPHILCIKNKIGKIEKAQVGKKLCKLTKLRNEDGDDHSGSVIALDFMIAKYFPTPVISTQSTVDGIFHPPIWFHSPTENYRRAIYHTKKGQIEVNLRPGCSIADKKSAWGINH